MKEGENIIKLRVRSHEEQVNYLLDKLNKAQSQKDKNLITFALDFILERVEAKK